MMGMYWKASDRKLKHQHLMDGLKVYDENEFQINSLFDAMYIFCSDLRMPFRLKKCSALILRETKSNVWAV